MLRGSWKQRVKSQKDWKTVEIENRKNLNVSNEDLWKDGEKFHSLTNGHWNEMLGFLWFPFQKFFNLLTFHNLVTWISNLYKMHVFLQGIRSVLYFSKLSAK